MKTALHSVSYAGVWMGQTMLPVEKVIEKAAAFGYDGVMLMAKRPHASLLDMNAKPTSFAPCRWARVSLTTAPSSTR